MVRIPDPKGIAMLARVSRVWAAATVMSLAALTGCSSPAPVDEASSAPSVPSASSPSPSATSPTSGTVDQSAIARDLEALETEFEVRIGVSAIDTATGESVDFRAEERFGFASTLKAFTAAEFLRSVPVDERDAPVTWTQDDVDRAGYSPVTSANVDAGLTLAELAEASVRDSDNAATNLILDHIGGPSGLGEGLALLGDTTTRVVDGEPALNTVESGSTDNTTTPRAFTANLVALQESEFLSPADYEILVDWMSGNETGDALVRAGAPEGWTVADKSGGAGPRRNDIAIVSPPGRAPIVITVLTERLDLDADYDDEIVARAAQVVLSSFS